VQSRIPPYPPPPPNSTYVRTGTLGRVITAWSGSFPGALTRVESLSGGGSIGYIGGNLEYIAAVIGEGQQADAHAGRWYTLESVLRESRPGIFDIFRDAVRKAIR
jgi:hypothetical protein